MSTSLSAVAPMVPEEEVALNSSGEAVPTRRPAWSRRLLVVAAGVCSGVAAMAACASMRQVRRAAPPGVVGLAEVGPRPACAWEGDNCQPSGCCRHPGFKCFAKNESHALCGQTCANASLDDEEPWTCHELGGDMGEHVLLKSSDPAGTSLYCFAVVTPQGVVPPGVKEGYEQSLLDLMRTKQLGIFQCDASGVFQGRRASKGDWQSVANTDIFRDAWKQVQQAGVYRKHDWTVKADADAVFLPQRLRMHIASMAPPPHTPVYLHNINFKFHFMGALEVLSAQAVDVLLGNFGRCIKSFGMAGGEDFFTKQCLDASGVGHMTDFSILDDKYTHSKGWHLFDVSPCENDAIVAFHPYKHAHAWEGCYNVSTRQSKPEDYVGCNLRWHGDACSLTSKLAHEPEDPETTAGVVAFLRK
mmetsp:Transcript_67768/g.195936  ORF Transcript_67768/g.195936 Transcript_67768/m.195936 type:complete len:415 (+) Transcript_67768:51-1295(+)